MGTYAYPQPKSGSRTGGAKPGMPGPRDTDIWGAVRQSDTYFTTNSLAAGSKLSVPERQKGGRPIGRPPF